MINFYNCGQGDCAEIVCCRGPKNPLFIDLGTNNFSLPPRGDIDLIITHSHNDHILGDINKLNNIKHLYVPAYWPEAITILNRLAKKKCEIQTKNLKLQLLYEGARIAKLPHCEILNPPLDPFKLFGHTDDSILNDKDLNDYLSQFETSLEELNDLISQSEIFTYQKPEGYDINKFIRSFITSLNNENMNEKYVIHDMCVVFKYYCYRDTYLFTGDATTKVFERLINTNKDITCNILKVPHHGSNKNLTPNILTEINPSIAIISHKNYLRNGSDPHPNLEILDLLVRNEVRTYFTNDVIKNSYHILGKHIGLIPSSCAYIIQDPDTIRRCKLEKILYPKIRICRLKDVLEPWKCLINWGKRLFKH